MADPRRTAVRNAGAFLPPDLGGGGPIPVPANALNVGPGEPGPEDEWKIPAWPEDETKPTDEATPAAVPAAHGSGLLHRLTHRG
jgi:hypothetical protein